MVSAIKLIYSPHSNFVSFPLMSFFLPSPGSSQRPPHIACNSYLSSVSSNLYSSISLFFNFHDPDSFKGYELFYRLSLNLDLSDISS